ncbi:MAG TPA: hypothetical protein VGX03_17985 [Candidatus Binatia bacterium]|nr:hypothetical protein [Candidatus Binatia bacterium]
MIDGKEFSLTPTPHVGRLDSLQAVRLELVRVYKDMRRGRIESREGTRLAYVLLAVARVLEQSDLEARIEKLEKGSTEHGTIEQ